MEENEIEYFIKILTIGESGAGKTSVILRYTDNCFSHKYISTIGVECKAKILNINNKNIRVNLWDTAGQERFRKLSRNYFKGAHGVALVYDVTNRDSFEKVTGWLEDVCEYASPNTVIAIGGNKIDMTNLRVVSEEEGLEYAAKFGVKYFEISAKTGDGVPQIFDYISTKIIESMDVIPNFINKSRKSFLLATSEKRKNQPRPGGCCK